MVFLLLQHLLRNEHGKSAVLDAQLLDLGIEPCLNLLPDKPRGGLNQVSRVSVEELLRTLRM